MTYRLITDPANKQEQPPNPRKNASIFEVITFSWILNLFKTGQKRDLDENDLYKILSDYESSSLGNDLEKNWKIELDNAKNANRNPSLLRAFIRMIGIKYAFYGFLLFIDEIVIRMSQPLLIGELLKHFHSDDSKKTSLEHAYFCAFGIVLSMFFSTALRFAAHTSSTYSSMKVRVACCSVIYRKALLLNHKSLGETTVGQMINLASNDVSKFDEALIFGQYVWIGALQTCVVTYLLWREIGISSLPGMIMLIFFIVIQGWMVKKIKGYRLRTANKTDERIRLLNEIVSGMRVIKMHTWEIPFAKLVRNARKKEIGQIRRSTLIKMGFLSFNILQTKFNLFISLLAYVLLGNHITVQKVFVLTSIYNTLLRTMPTLFCEGLEKTTEMLISIRRIQSFLLLEEKICVSSTSTDAVIDNNEFKYDSHNIPMINIDPPNHGGVIISNVTAKWDNDQTFNTLESINLTVKPNQLVALIGPIGAGKSSLIQSILGELPLSRGKISVGGVISFASQKPWLFAGTVRQNILFDSKMNDQRYKQVIEVCALVNDFEQFPYGDRTIVGERGVTLSGGQRARINLARAVYKQADIYLLDDPLSAVDTRVGQHIFQKCIKDYLKYKTCILTTHHMHYLTRVDQIVLMENSNILANGSYRELQSSGFDFVKLFGSSDETTIDSVFESENIDDGNSCVSRSILPSCGSNGQIATPAAVNKPNESLEKPDGGTEGLNDDLARKSKYVFIQYMSAAGSNCKVLFMFSMYIIAQVINTGTDYWITYWVNEEDNVFRDDGSASTVNGTSMTQNIPSKLGESSNFRSTCVSVYTVLIVSLLVTLFVGALICNSVFMGISTNIHKRMFDAIIKTPMLFFSKNPSGRILNRFSKDIAAVDEMLPVSFMFCLHGLFRFLGIMTVVGSVNIYLMFPTLMIVVIFCWFRSFYLPTTQCIKRLEAAAQSPVFSHLSTSVGGLTTVRAFEAQQILTDVFHKYQDLHSSALYLCVTSQQAFCFWLDMVCVSYVSVIIFSFLVIEKNFQGGYVGLTITQTVLLIGLVQWFMKKTFLLETQMTSFERVNDYTNKPQEVTPQSLPEKTAPNGWPKMGKIVFHNLNFRYSPDAPYVLKNINFKIQPMEKVGIVGRTGAGKSSIIEALFRLALNDGNIIIDDIEVHELALHHLRSKISIIPQEPVLFSGTIRKNLDPFDEHPDNVLWDALDEVELKFTIDNLPGGLSTKISESGSNFSVGQRQLICLARAMLRNNKIIVLDEATANLDPQTDVLIQNTIRNKFRACTVLTVAHRLNTIIDSDKVLVMEAGTVVEFDHPYNLLKNEEGFFYKMVEQTEPVTTDLLHNVAAENWSRRNKLENRSDI